MMKLIPVHGLVCFALLAAGSSGCQDPVAPKLVPVQGLVKFKQRPLRGATICFIPDITKGNRDGLQATAQTTEDGAFTLQTYPHGDGLMPGWYKVTCIVFGGVALPQKYRNATQTPLLIEVKRLGDEHVLLNLAD
jgi:hypothetical protein